MSLVKLIHATTNVLHTYFGYRASTKQVKKIEGYWGLVKQYSCAKSKLSQNWVKLIKMEKLWK